LGNGLERYWGKAVDGYHLAVLHSLDVAAVAERITRENVVLARKLSRQLGVPLERAPQTVAAFVGLHDVGKFDVRFQLKARDVAVALDPSRGALALSTHYDHGACGYHQLEGERAYVHARLGDGAMPLLLAVTGHHGRLPSRQTIAADPKWHCARSARADDEAARRALIDAISDVFVRRDASLPWRGTATASLVTILAGLCSVADWIGSQVEYFPYQSALTDLTDYFESKAQPAARRALDAIGFLSARPSGKSFVELFPTRTPRDLQRIVEDLDLPSGANLVLLEAQSLAYSASMVPTLVLENTDTF
jgi:CRISPR-associated endonuclease/helicase Cas3